MVRKFLVIAAWASISLWSHGAAYARDTDEEVELQPLSADVATQFDQMLAEIEMQKDDIERIESRLGEFEGEVAVILGARRDRIRTSMFQNTSILAKDVAEQKVDGKDVSVY